MSWDESADYSTDVVVPKWNFGKLIAVPGGSGPPGPKGDTGDVGPQGEVGPVGPSGNMATFASLSVFPAAGDSANLYVAEDTGDSYRWDGAKYVRISERVSAVGIEDSSEVGRAVVTAADEKAARTAITAERQRVLNVADFGVDLTGATPSDAAFQAVLNAAAAGSGIVEVYIPPGTVSLTTNPTVGSQVTVRGAGASVTKVVSSHVNGVFNLAGAADITISDLAVEASQVSTSAQAISKQTTGLLERVTITRCKISGNRGLRFGSGAVNGVRVIDNLFVDCPSGGFNLRAPAASSGLISRNIAVSRNSFRNVGSTNISVYGPGSGDARISTINGVEISGNDLRDFNQTSTEAGPIPIEPSGVTNLRVINNTIDGPATRGISTGANVVAVFAGNTIRNQSTYAFELGGGRQISIVGNTVENCAVLAQETGSENYATQVRLTDVVIANNTYTNSGKSSAYASSAVRLFSARRCRIANNVFTDWQNLESAISVGTGASSQATVMPEDCVVEGNTFVITDPATKSYTIDVDCSQRTRVLRNNIVLRRDLVSTDRSMITVVMRDDIADTLIEGNHITFAGTVDASPNASGIANNSAPGALCPRLTVRRNTVIGAPRGIRLSTTSTDLVVDDNDTSRCVSADLLPSTVTFSNHKFGTLDVGHLTDTTLSRVSAGVLAVENVQLSRAGHTHTASEVLGALSWAAVPASATSTGTAGQMAYANGFLYICVAANQWQRVALAAW